jgi:hypothetical protein
VICGEVATLAATPSTPARTLAMKEPPMRTSKIGLILVPAGLAAAGALVLVSVSSVPEASASSAASASSLRRARVPAPAPLSRADLEIIAARAGITPDTLTAAGLGIPQVQRLVGLLSTSAQGQLIALRTADDAAGRARDDRDRLARLITAGIATEQDRASLKSAKATLATAELTVRNCLDAIYNASCDGIDPSAKSMLDAIRTTDPAGRELPVEYRVGGRNEAQWVALRDALANERISAARREDPDPAATQLLSTIRAESAVAAARSNIANIAAVKSAWSAAIAASLPGGPP